MYTNSRNHSEQDEEQSYDSLADLVDLGAGITATMLMPTLWYCSSIGQIWPVQLLGVELVLGTIIGSLVYRLPSSAVITINLTKPPRVTAIEAYRRRHLLSLPK
jgi:hypothetical protein